MKFFRQPKIPVQPPVQVAQGSTQIRVPDQSDPRVKAAGRQRARQDEKERQGRGSTNFARGRGGPAYSRKQLG